MDKKNTTIGVVLLAAAFVVLYLAPHSTPTTRPQTAQPAATPSQAPAAATAGAPAPAAAAPAPTGEFAAVSREKADAKTITLANDFIEARLTNFGGAVRDVAFKKYPAVEGKSEPYVFNLVHEDPILALTEFPGLGKDQPYEVVSSTPTEVVFRRVVDDRIEVIRRYALVPAGAPGADPYRLQHETTFRNLTDAAVPLRRAGLSVGTSALVNSADTGQYLNIAVYNGDDVQFIERGELEGGGIGALFGGGSAPKPVLERPGQAVWVAAKNQFFASIYTPDTPAAAVVVRRIELPAFPDSRTPNIGMTGAARFDLPALAPKGTATISGKLYVGPQEYPRLAQLEKREDKVLPYTQYFFSRIFLSGYVAPLLNTLMNAMHKWTGNWGIAIILMTLTLKIVTLPFTLVASRSAKRMAKLQPLMQEIREKYKDNPQKQQQATMELFKQHKVNPLGGCIPVLITMPLFIGFFSMLQCTAELRLQPFLWATDLSAPDTIAHVFGIPINIMPLLMGATMVIQMQITPTPSVDNVQMKMMKFMPIIFTLFCYGFACSLALYSTINGLFTIGQQLVINRMKDEPGPAGPGTAAATTAAAWKKQPKNVTPKKK